MSALQLWKRLKELGNPDNLRYRDRGRLTTDYVKRIERNQIFRNVLEEIRQRPQQNLIFERNQIFRNVLEEIRQRPQKGEPPSTPRRDEKKEEKTTGFITTYNVKVIPYKPFRDTIQIMENEITRGLSFKTRLDPRQHKPTRDKIKAEIARASQSGFYNKAFVIDASITMTGEEMYRTKNLPLPEPVVKRVRKTPRGFGGIVLKTGNPPEFSSLGTNSKEWNTEDGKCAINAVLFELAGTYAFKNLTRESIYQDMKITPDSEVTVYMLQTWLLDRKVRSYIIDGSNTVIWSNIIKSSIKQGEKIIFLKIDNGHIYPIQDDHMKQEIIRLHKVKPAQIDWLEPKKYTEKLNENGFFEGNQSKINLIGLTKEPTGALCNNLNGLALKVLTEKNIIVEDLNIDTNGNILQFSYQGNWYVMDPDYPIVNGALEQSLTIPKIKNSKVLAKRFEKYQGQKVQNITKDLLKILSGELPKSILNTDTLTMWERYAQGAYNATLYPDSEIDYKKLVTRDIRRCYTSIVYNREHAWGVFTPWDEFRPYRGKIIQGAFYIVRTVKLDTIELGDGIYDSEFVEKILKKGLILESQIEQEIVPFKSLPADHYKKLIDTVYETFPDNLAKPLINKFLGTLNSSGKSTRNAFLTTSKDIADEWFNRSPNHTFNQWSLTGIRPPEGRCEAVVLQGGLEGACPSSYLCYETVQKRVIETNMPMFYSIICGSYYQLYTLAQAMKPHSNKIVKYHTDSVTVEAFHKNGFPEIEVPFKPNKWNLGSIRSTDPDIPGHIRSTIRVVDWKAGNNKKKVLRDPVVFPWGVGGARPHGILIRGSGGRGKTYSIVNRVIPFAKRCVCTSTANKALENLHSQGVPKGMLRNLTSLFSPHPTGSPIQSHLKNLAKSYDTIIADEYSMISQHHMTLLYRLHLLGVTIVFAGDGKQIPGIDDRNIKYEKFKFFNEMVNVIVELTVNHRFDKALDEVAMNVYEHGFFFWSTLSDKEDINIAYLNKTVNRINREFSDCNNKYPHIIGKNGYCFKVGSPVISEVNKKDLINGKLYKVHSFDEKNVVVAAADCFTAPANSNLTTLTREGFKECFNLAHAITTHKLQGTTLKGTVCIHDIGRMSRELLYTALTRLTSLDLLRVPKPIDLNNIRSERFFTQWEPKCITRTKSEGYIYELIEILESSDSKTTSKPFYIGSTIHEIEQRYKEHQDSVATGTAWVYKHIRENKIKFDIRILQTVKYDDEQKLRDVELRTINTFVRQGGILYNQQGVKIEKPPKRLRKGAYIVKKQRSPRGSIKVQKRGVEFRWSVNGKRKSKRFRITKKRSLEQALQLAKDFQLSIYR